MVVAKQIENNINISFLGPLVDYLLQLLNARSMNQIFANWNLAERAEKEIKDLKGIFFILSRIFWESVLVNKSRFKLWEFFIRQKTNTLILSIFGEEIGILDLNSCKWQNP